MAKKKKDEKAPLDREQLSGYKPSASVFDSMSIVADPTLNSLFELAKTTNTFVVPSTKPLKNNVLPSSEKTN